MGVIPSIIKLIFDPLPAAKKAILLTRLAKFQVTHDHGRAPRDFINGKSLKGNFFFSISLNPPYPSFSFFLFHFLRGPY